MDDLNRSIRQIAEEVRALQEQLVAAGLLREADRRRAWRWELARRMAALFERLQRFFVVHHHAPACRAAMRPASPNVRRPH